MISLKCKICFKDFCIGKYREKTAKYCSKKCQRVQIKHFCLHCSAEFLHNSNRKRKYCSKTCSNKARIVHNIEPKKTNNFRKFWERRGIIDKCEICGYDKIKKILGIHHIDKNHNNNRRENLQVLCANCHSLQHLKHIPHINSIF